MWGIDTVIAPNAGVKSSPMGWDVIGWVGELYSKLGVPRNACRQQMPRAQPLQMALKGWLTTCV